jgi:hypothetical protein
MKYKKKVYLPHKKQGYFSKNTLIFKNTPTKTGVLSEKTYNFAPSNQ